MQRQNKNSIYKKRLLLFSFLIILTIIAAVPAQGKKITDANELTGMSLDDLMNIEVVSTASLTETKPRLVPAAVTTITAEQIKASGARSLYELLDIYVPNLEWLRNHWEPDSLGLRGIIGDRNDKFLLLVNGRNMNQRTHSGAISELDLVLLRDIHHIDVVRGPGSALYGPGAVSMVINIVTFNGETFQGTETTARMGAVEEFYSGEVKHGQKFDSNDGGAFVYAGVGKYDGASVQNAPQVFPFTFTPGAPPFEYDGTEAGEPFTKGPIRRDGASARGLSPVKLFAEITKGDWDIWARYTSGGKQFAPAVGVLARPPYGWANSAINKPSYYDYQQATGWVGYKHELVKDIDIDLAFSYDLFDFDNVRKGNLANNFREDQFYGRALLRFQPNDQHRIAVGSEISYMKLGMKDLGFPPATDDVAQEFPYVTMPFWSTNLYSLLGEWQWTINDKWTTFLGGRVDDHTYTDIMISPRAALVHTPDEKNTYKFMWSRSVRANFEAEMKKQDMGTGDHTSKPEKLDNIEFRYERKHNENLDLAASLFVHYNLEVISWNQSEERSIPVGTQKDYGIEVEALYHTDNTRLMISHAYTKLLDFKVQEGQTSYISAKPYGYGDDLTNWSNHITKVSAEHKLNAQWTLDSTLRIYWGFPGMREFDKYLPYSNVTSTNSVIEDGWERAYRGSYYLNLGLRYKPSDDLTIGLTGYYLLGIFDKDLNKRNYVEVVGNGDFRSHAPAVGVSVEYKF